MAVDTDTLSPYEQSVRDLKGLVILCRARKHIIERSRAAVIAATYSGRSIEPEWIAKTDGREVLGMLIDELVNRVGCDGATFYRFLCESERRQSRASTIYIRNMDCRNLSLF